MDSGSEFSGLKMTVIDHFWAVLGAFERHSPLRIGLLSPQICTDLRGVKNPWKIGGNPPIGGKESTLAQLGTVKKFKDFQKWKFVSKGDREVKENRHDFPFLRIIINNNFAI